MVEFNLSKKVTPAYGWNDNTEVILAEEVKKFIRLLKKELAKGEHFGIVVTNNRIIDKLAGDKLIS